MPLTASSIAPGLVALHSNRTELLAATLAHWTHQHPLHVLEQEIILVQSNGMAEWLKMALAQELGISAAIQVELPGRFAWRMYRQILGAEQVPYQTPLDKPDMLWQLMRLLPQLTTGVEGQDPIWLPLQHMVRPRQNTDHSAPPTPEALYQLAQRIADLLDQYQVYRPDWLDDWAQGHDTLAVSSPHSAAAPRESGDHLPIPPDSLWQPALWRRLLQTQSAAQAAAIRPRLHQRALQALQQGAVQSPLPRRVSLFGMSHVALPIIELLSHMAQYSQVLMAIPNPCQEYWSDALDGRELFARLRKQLERPARPGQKTHADALANIPLHAMHAHANPLLAMWGRQVRDFIRLLEHYEHNAALHTAPSRTDIYPQETEAAPTLLQQVQQQIRDLVPLSEPLTATIATEDRSIAFQSTHSPVREVEALHDHLLNLMLPTAASGAAPVTPRDIVVMVPDIEQYAPLIEAIFGQYPPQDSRHIPFDIADLGAQSTSTLVQALEWLVRLPEQRAALADVGDLLRVPAIALRIGIDEAGAAQLHAWMQGSGMRWGIDHRHREHLGVHAMGEQNTAWFGLQRMLLAFASDHAWQGTEPYPEIGGLAAADVGALAYLINQLQHWQHTLSTPATPAEWAVRWRSLVSAFFKASDDADQAALKLVEQALQQWQDATAHAEYDQPIPLEVARHAWLGDLQAPQAQQRFHAGGVTFCTLLPMRAIPFRIVCLLGMDEGVYPRRASPNEMDLMRLPGLLRAGDRSRAQDDRQLMLEALLSAREQLFISWVGRNVRDNTERPPSLLVAQLRDYLSQRWSPSLVQERTTEHPLQPFNTRYFSASAPAALHTWANEWRPRPAPQAPVPAATPLHHNPTTLDETDHRWSVAALAEVWRNPVQKWFTSRLQTRFATLPDLLDDCEPLALDGLQHWQIFEALAQALAPHMQAHATSEQLQDIATQHFARLQRSGALPIGGLAQQLQTQWQAECQFFLHEWLAAVQRWPYSPPQRQPLWWPAQPAQVEDWAPTKRQANADASAPSVYMAIYPHRILQKPAGSLKIRHLLHTWLQAILLAAHAGEPSESAASATPMQLIALDAVLEITPLDPDSARQDLASIVAIARQAIQTPLPFDLVTALSWWDAGGATLAATHNHASADTNGEEENDDKAPSNTTEDAAALKALQAARNTYDGGHFAGQTERNPYIARIWPDFDALWATDQFEALAQQMLAPMQHWLDHCVHIRYAEEPQA